MLRWNGVIDMSEEHIQNRIKTMADKAKSNRVLLWDRIKKNDPSLALFLTRINQEFGRPTKLRVEIDGKVIGEVNR